MGTSLAIYDKVIYSKKYLSYDKVMYSKKYLSYDKSNVF